MLCSVHTVFRKLGISGCDFDMRKRRYSVEEVAREEKRRRKAVNRQNTYIA